MFATLLAFGAVGAPGHAAPKRDALSLELIMADPQWMGSPPLSPRWASDGKSVFFERRLPDSEARATIELQIESGSERTLPHAERARAATQDRAWSSDRRYEVHEHEGDIHLWDARTSTLTNLTRTGERESKPRFLTDDEHVSFRRDSRFFVRHLESGLVSEPFELRFEDDPGRQTKTPTVMEEKQLELFDYLKKRKGERESTRELNASRRDADPTRSPRPYYLGKTKKLNDAWLSPSGTHLLAALSKKDRKEGTRTLMPLWVTESGHVESRDVRSKVGDGEREAIELVLLDARTHEAKTLDLSVLPGIKEDPLADLRAKAKEAERRRKPSPEDGSAADAETDESDRTTKRRSRDALRALSLQRAVWREDGQALLLMLRARDNKDRWIASVDLESGKLVPHHRLTDPGWINWAHNELGWIPGSESFFFLSEETGFSQLMLQRTGSGLGRRERRARQLTFGRQVVSRVVATRDGRFLYFLANPERPGVHEVHRVDVESGEAEVITSLGSRLRFQLSPDERQLLLRAGTTTSQPELHVQDARPGAAARQLTDSASEQFRSIPWTAPQLVEVPSRHGAGSINSRLYLPHDKDAAPQGSRPAVVFIHGAGYLQNAHEGWSGYFREFMFHSLLTARGFVVLDMDYRASAGYGRAWRTAIYQNMGTPEVEDLKDGVQYLVDHAGVDPERVGCYGGSYGGFLALMALFKEPDLFACGAALRPVTDWAHYSHGYTSNILNTPDLDPEAYARSSPIEFADGLTKPLLICAPMLDDNVHFQDVVRLVQRLIELEKSDFETALFPVEPHGFKQPSSWLHEYRKILTLFETHLLNQEERP